MDEIGVGTAALAEPFDDPVNVPLGVVDQPHLQGRALTQNLVELNIGGRLGQQIELEMEGARWSRGREIRSGAERLCPAA